MLLGYFCNRSMECDSIYVSFTEARSSQCSPFQIHPNSVRFHDNQHLCDTKHLHILALYSFWEVVSVELQPILNHNIYFRYDWIHIESSLLTFFRSIVFYFASNVNKGILNHSCWKFNIAPIIDAQRIFLFLNIINNPFRRRYGRLLVDLQ